MKPNLEKATFIASVIAWLRGIKKSTVLNEYNARETFDDEIWLQSPNEETLSIKSFEDEHAFVMGVRHELPDNAGRKWRTECVYRQVDGNAYLRVRGQCVATQATAEVITPLKPHFITQSLEENWAAPDGLFTTGPEPIELRNDEHEIAQSVLQGDATHFLPCIYVSRDNRNQLPLDVGYLSRKLAGICHVVTEPNRSFSFDLMALAEQRNPYGGAVGIILPNGQEIARFFKRRDDFNGNQMADACINRANTLISGFAPKHGWEWQQLQEAQSRKLRETALAGNSEALTEYIEHFDTELQAKDEQIENLKLMLELERQNNTPTYTDSESLVPPELAKCIGDEIYEGEFSDRLRHYLICATNESCPSIHERTKLFIEKYLQTTNFTGRSSGVIAQIKRASRDGSSILQNLGPLLTDLGFTKSYGGKHIKFSAPTILFGLANETFPSTPSDSQRGGKNRGADIIRNFGLSDLK